MKKFLYVLIVILLTNVSAFCDEFGDTLTMAEKGDADAQFRLGAMYAYGQEVAKDYKQAVRWYTKAAEQGDPRAQIPLGAMYYQGQGVRQDHKQAIKWYTRAAEQGKAVAQSFLGIMYYEGQGVKKDYKQAYVWSSLAAAQGGESAIKNRDIIAKDLTAKQLAKAHDLVAQIQYKIDNPAKGAKKK